MPQSGITDMAGFKLGEPALVCRWRLANRQLPLTNRHMRALMARMINGEHVTSELAAWAKQHIEWTLEQGAAENPNGTLMLIVDTDKRAAMTVGPYVSLPNTTLNALAHRATKAQNEAMATGVAPETLWLVCDGHLVWNLGEGHSPSGTSSLVAQLAQTLGIPVETRADLLDGLVAQTISFDEAFLVSDEHGVVPTSDAQGPHGQRMAQGYQRLLDKTR